MLVIRGRGCHMTGAESHSEMGSREWEEPGSLKTTQCYRADFRLHENNATPSEGRPFNL